MSIGFDVRRPCKCDDWEGKIGSFVQCEGMRPSGDVMFCDWCSRMLYVQRLVPRKVKLLTYPTFPYPPNV